MFRTNSRMVWVGAFDQRWYIMAGWSIQEQHGIRMNGELALSSFSCSQLASSVAHRALDSPNSLATKSSPTLRSTKHNSNIHKKRWRWWFIFLIKQKVGGAFEPQRLVNHLQFGPTELDRPNDLKVSEAMLAAQPNAHDAERIRVLTSFKRLKWTIKVDGLDLKRLNQKSED